MLNAQPNAIDCRSKMRQMNNKSNFTEAIGSIVIWLSIVGLLSLGLYTFYLLVSASGQADYCFVDATSYQGLETTKYRLYAHRPWRSNTSLGMYPSLEEAKKQADSIGCAIK